MFKNWLLAGTSLRAYAPPSLCSIDGEGELLGGGGEEASFETLANDILSRLDDVTEEVDGAAARSQSADEAGAAPAGTQPSGEGRPEAEPSEGTPIEPPLSWSKEHKERWAALPRETQEYLHSREQERDAAVRRGQNEAAEIRKASEAERAAATQERQRSAAAANTFVQLAQTLDPVLAEGSKMDWAKLAREEPGEYVARRAAYDNRVAQLRAAVQESQSAAQQAQIEHFHREETALLEKMPEWKADPAKARTELDDIRKGAIERYGYGENDVQVIRDHRIVAVVRDALAYHKLVADQATEKAKVAAGVQAKRVPAQPARLAGGAAPTGAGNRGSNAALKQRGGNTSLSIDDRAAAILAQL